MISPQATAVAQKYLQGVPDDQMLGALGNALGANPNVSLSELIAAHRILSAEQKKQQAQQAMQMAQRGSGMSGIPSAQTTVAQQVTQALQNANQNMEQQIAQGSKGAGIAGLEAGNIGTGYAGGGIVAFADNQDQPIGPNMPTEEGSDIEAYGRRLDEARAALAGVRPPGVIQMKQDPAAMDRYRALQERQDAVQKAYESALGRVSAYHGVTPGVGGIPSTLSPSASSMFPAGSAPAPSDDIYPKGLPAATPAVRAVQSAQPSGGLDYTQNPVYKVVMDRGEESRRLLREALGKAPELPSDEAAQDLARTQREKALEKAGIPKAAYKGRIDELKAQATQAREDRDTDRWLALAQGFFAMGAGKSPYALQNISEGLGVSTKQLKEAETEYRKSEKARQEQIALMQEAQRKEVMGDVDAGRKRREQAERRWEDHKKAEMTMLGHLSAGDEQALTRLVASMEGAATRRELAAGRQQEAAARQEDRRMQTYAALQQRLQEKHPGTKTLQQLDGTLALLQQQLAAKPGDPNLSIKINALQEQMNRLKQQIDMDVASDARRYMGDSSGFKYKGVQG